MLENKKMSVKFQNTKTRQTVHCHDFSTAMTVTNQTKVEVKHFITLAVQWCESNENTLYWYQFRVRQLKLLVSERYFCTGSSFTEININTYTLLLAICHGVDDDMVIVYHPHKESYDMTFNHQSYHPSNTTSTCVTCYLKLPPLSRKQKNSVNQTMMSILHTIPREKRSFHERSSNKIVSCSLHVWWSNNIYQKGHIVFQYFEKHTFKGSSFYIGCEVIWSFMHDLNSNITTACSQEIIWKTVTQGNAYNGNNCDNVE